MKRLLQQNLLLATLLFVATSCIDIQESVYLRENGSGKFALTVNLENLESLIRMAESFSGESGSEKDIISEAEVDFESLRKKLEKQKGISQVTTIRENESKLIGIAFDFEDVKSLNNALRELNDGDGAPTEYFTYRQGQLHRVNTIGLKDQVENKIEADIDLSVDGVMVGSLMKDMTYTTKYTFERPVKKTSNPNAKITNEGRTVTLTYHFFDQEATAISSIENNISF